MLQAHRSAGVSCKQSPYAKNKAVQLACRQVLVHRRSNARDKMVASTGEKPQHSRAQHSQAAQHHTQHLLSLRHSEDFCWAYQGDSSTVEPCNHVDITHCYCLCTEVSLHLSLQALTKVPASAAIAAAICTAAAAAILVAPCAVAASTIRAAVSATAEAAVLDAAADAITRTAAPLAADSADSLDQKFNW